MWFIDRTTKTALDIGTLRKSLFSLCRLLFFQRYHRRILMHSPESVVPFKINAAVRTASKKTRTRIFTPSLIVCKGGGK
jgi:hypothetical protein